MNLPKKESNCLEISSFFNFDRIAFQWSKEIGTWSVDSKYPSLLVQVICFLFILESNVFFCEYNWIQNSYYLNIFSIALMLVCRNDRFVIDEKISCSTSFSFLLKCLLLSTLSKWLLHSLLQNDVLRTFVLKYTHNWVVKKNKMIIKCRDIL